MNKYAANRKILSSTNKAVVSNLNCYLSKVGAGLAQTVERIATGLSTTAQAVPGSLSPSRKMGARSISSV